ncbi:MAG TPA: alpha/beta fold hydrolase, partial [Candidatus Acidoferrales bacterium]|nr:alpha/beta fold hydrolase [Candidatus Acidoferrales bacterium]
MASEVSGPRFPASTLPFLLPAGSSGALLLHGLSATPEEMRFLGDHLHARGHSVNAVRLAGHGTSVDDLERCRWQDWYASARQGLSTLQQHASHITVVGLSMGALLAVQLAASHG